jgi:hypothetical protein
MKGSSNARFELLSLILYHEAVQASAPTACASHLHHRAGGCSQARQDIAI